MEVKVEVTALEVVTRSGTNERGQWQMHEQVAYLHLSNQQYPLKITLSLPKERQGTPWPVGWYQLDLVQSLYVGGYGKLQLGTLYLAPIPSPAATGPLKTGTDR